MRPDLRKGHASIRAWLSNWIAASCSSSSVSGTAKPGAEIDFTPNPQRRHTRGRRGKEFGVSHDDQIDFEQLHVDPHERDIDGKRRDQARTAAVKKKKYVYRGFRGKVDKELSKQERDSFKLHKARARRSTVGIVKKSAKAVQIAVAVNRFTRLGRVPAGAIDTYVHADHAGVNTQELGNMLVQKCVRGKGVAQMTMRVAQDFVRKQLHSVHINWKPEHEDVQVKLPSIRTNAKPEREDVKLTLQRGGIEPNPGPKLGEVGAPGSDAFALKCHQAHDGSYVVADGNGSALGPMMSYTDHTSIVSMTPKHEEYVLFNGDQHDTELDHCWDQAIDIVCQEYHIPKDMFMIYGMVYATQNHDMPLTVTYEYVRPIHKFSLVENRWIDGRQIVRVAAIRYFSELLVWALDISRMLLLRAGIEPNPGPKTKRPSKEKDEKPTKSSTSSSTDATPVPPATSGGKAAREQEKKDARGGNEPDDKKRIEGKKRNGYGPANVLEKEMSRQADANVAQTIAEEDLEEEEAAEDAENVEQMYQPGGDSAFVMRSEGFARPWYVGFGTPQNVFWAITSVWRYLIVLWQWLRGMGDLPLYDPRNGAVWRRYDPYDDAETVTPVFKGIVFSVGMAVTIVCLLGFTGLVCGLLSFGYLTGLIMWIVNYVVDGALLLNAFSLLFRPLLRYGSNDRMCEMGTPSPLLGRWYSDRTDTRPAHSRNRVAKDEAYLSTVDCTMYTVADASNWYSKYMFTSWVFGSLFSWVETVRLIKIVISREQFVISMRMVNEIMHHLSSSKLESFEETLAKARSLGGQYDLLKLSTAPVLGRNVVQDSMMYAACKFFSRAAADASLGNGVVPHSD